jgi:hypothetical protein
MANCGPPYKRGYGEWCGCKCNCCPPSTCNIVWKVSCGVPCECPAECSEYFVVELFDWPDYPIHQEIGPECEMYPDVPRYQHAVWLRDPDPPGTMVEVVVRLTCDIEDDTPTWTLVMEHGIYPFYDGVYYNPMRATKKWTSCDADGYPPVGVVVFNPEDIEVISEFEPENDPHFPWPVRIVKNPLP